MKKGNYVDGFVLCVPKKNAAKYRKMASEGRAAWMKFGALDYKECRIDDVRPKGVVFNFPKMAKAKPGEQVWFSFIVFTSRKHRDAVNKKVMAHFGTMEMKDSPFDMRRFAYGGFNVVIGN